jgi:hypothetical protein
MMRAATAAAMMIKWILRQLIIHLFGLIVHLVHNVLIDAVSMNPEILEAKRSSSCDSTLTFLAKVLGAFRAENLQPN